MHGPKFNPEWIEVDWETVQSIALLAGSCAPWECCGLLGGIREERGVRVLGHFPLTNVLGRPDRFEGDPREHFQALRSMRVRGWDWVGTYHSHPASAPFPSALDRERAQGPGMVDLIAGRAEPPAGQGCQAKLCQGWWMAWWRLETDPVWPLAWRTNPP